MAFKYSIKQLVSTVRFAKANPNATITINHPGWFPEYFTGEEYVRWFRRQLHEKISHTLANAGRRHTPDYQSLQRRDSRVINDHARRVMHRGSGILATPELRTRYPHINIHLGDN